MSPDGTYRPWIGVTPGWAAPNPARDFCRTAEVLYCDQNYMKRIEEAGGLPVLLPHIEDEAGIDRLTAELDGLLLTGGEDVNPTHYGQDVHPETAIADARDAFELRLVRAFLPTRKPVFAICRGMQILNVALGGTLIQDIPTLTGFVHHSQKLSTTVATHEVQLQGGSALARLVGDSVTEVNSHHHQAVDVPGDGLRISAWSEEGIVEGIEHPGFPFLVAVQWHPERLSSRPVEQARLFRGFVDASRALHHA